MRRACIVDLEDLPTREKRRAALTQIYAAGVGGESDRDLIIDCDFGVTRRPIAECELARRYDLEVIQ